MPSTTHAKETRTTVIPSLRYKDAPAAIDWLCRAFGFEKQAVYPGPDNTVAHAQLTFGNGMIMLGSASNPSPVEAGPQSTCLIVADSDAVYASAKTNGATIVMDIADMNYGGRAFSCLDPEGHLWHIGTYDPWATAA